METLTISDNKGIRLITLDRPNALNAFSSLLMDELAESFLSAEQDKAVKVVVLTGAGRAFSAGADLAATDTWFSRYARGDSRLFKTIFISREWIRCRHRRYHLWAR